MFCKPEVIVADAGAYLFNRADIVAKATSFSFEAKTLTNVVVVRYSGKTCTPTNAKKNDLLGRSDCPNDNTKCITLTA